MARVPGSDGWHEFAARNDRAHGIKPWQFFRAMVEAGICDSDWDGLISRIVIDCNVEDGGYVRMYVERIGDQRLLRVGMGLKGIEVSLGTPEQERDGGQDIRPDAG